MIWFTFFIFFQINHFFHNTFNQNFKSTLLFFNEPRLLFISSPTFDEQNVHLRLLLQGNFEKFKFFICELQKTPDEALPYANDSFFVIFIYFRKRNEKKIISNDLGPSKNYVARTLRRTWCRRYPRLLFHL